MNQLNSKYSEQGYSIAMNSLEEIAPKNSKVVSLRYLFENYDEIADRKKPTKTFLISQTEKLFSEIFPLKKRNEQLYNDILDVLLTYHPRGRSILNQETAENEDTNHTNQPQETKRYFTREEKISIANKKTVYDDSQNVHNTHINKSGLKIASELFRICDEKISIKSMSEELKKEIITEIKSEIYKLFRFCNREKIEISYTYILKNIGNFGIGVSLKDMWISTWFWVQSYCDSASLKKNDEKREIEMNIKKRFTEELEEMAGKCSSGCLLRFASVPQGYTTDPALIIVISDIEQIKSVVTAYLTKQLRNCPDSSIIEDMSDENKKYKSFIRTSIKSVILGWVKEYGEEILESLPMIVNKYCNATIYKQ